MITARYYLSHFDLTTYLAKQIGKDKKRTKQPFSNTQLDMSRRNVMKDVCFLYLAEVFFVQLEVVESHDMKQICLADH